MAATVLPVIMGAVADVSGVNASFLIVGGALLLMLMGVAFFSRRVVAEAR
jgi:hypothetical protein